MITPRAGTNLTNVKSVVDAEELELPYDQILGQAENLWR